MKALSCINLSACANREEDTVSEWECNPLGPRAAYYHLMISASRDELEPLQSDIRIWKQLLRISQFTMDMFFLKKKI